MSEELKPCPFCGGTSPLVFPRTCNKDTPYNPADRAFPIVRCSGCYGEAAGSNWSEPATAIAAWNRRTDPLAASHQRLKEALAGVVASWDQRSHEHEQFYPARVDKTMGEIPAYWNPSASMVDSEAIAAAREALKDTP